MKLIFNEASRTSGLASMKIFPESWEDERQLVRVLGHSLTIRLHVDGYYDPDRVSDLYKVGLILTTELPKEGQNSKLYSDSTE